jgi:phage terminase small subunit
MKKELNEKQKMFCLEYLKDFNASRAYKKVYWWTDKTCRTNASRLLTNDNIQNYLAGKAEKKVEKVWVWVEYVLEKLQQVINIWMWEQEVELEEWKPKKVLDLSNVNSALEKLWKYHKMYTDKIEQEWDLNINIVSCKKWQN